MIYNADTRRSSMKYVDWTIIGIIAWIMPFEITVYYGE
jgi:hypothetical protein